MAGTPEYPQGHGFMAGIRVNLAGKLMRADGAAGGDAAESGDSDVVESLVLPGRGVCSRALPLSIEQAYKGFDVSHCVVNRIVIVGSDAKSLPALAVVEICRRGRRRSH